MIYADGMLVAIYLDIAHLETEPFLQALKRLRYDKSERSSGMKTNSRTFGYMPRRPLGRGDFCSASMLVNDSPAEEKIISGFVAQLAEDYKKLNPSLAKRHEELADKILPEWRIHGLYSSGIINQNNPLPYHLDTGNINNCWSIMPVFKQDIEGGHLAVPELDMCIELRDKTCLMFDGQSFLHGVTPFTKLQPDGYRYTVVYYTLKDLWQCLPFDQEVERARLKRTETEGRTARGELHEGIVKQLNKRKK